MRGYPEPSSIEVLFVTYGGGHVQMVLPVAQALHAPRDSSLRLSHNYRYCGCG